MRTWPRTSAPQLVSCVHNPGLAAGQHVCMGGFWGLPLYGIACKRDGSQCPPLSILLMQRHKLLEFLLTVLGLGDDAPSAALMARELRAKLAHRGECVYDTAWSAEAAYVIVSGVVTLYDVTAEVDGQGGRLTKRCHWPMGGSAATQRRAMPPARCGTRSHASLCHCRAGLPLDCGQSARCSSAGRALWCHLAATACGTGQHMASQSILSLCSIASAKCSFK